MFQRAIEQASAYTRPIHTITRNYGARHAVPGAATLFFVNNEGYAVTCKHVVEMLISADGLAKKYNDFRAERDKLVRDGKYKRHLKNLELKYRYTPETPVQVKSTFIDCVDYMSGFTAHIHPQYDLAILKFNDYRSLRYTGHAIFKKDTNRVRPGEYLCRLGFPFSEFSNFAYNEVSDEIEWTQEGGKASPRFPIDGMLTRFLADNNHVYGIEMSTPGLRGQSGGPLFNADGIVYGMQFSTKHLHSGFDMVDKEIAVRGKTRKVSDYSFLHLGQCIHADIIKAFLAQHSITYYEA